MVDEALLGQPNKHRPVVDPLLEVGWKVAFIDDLDLYSGYRVFPNIADLGGLERKRERCQTSAPDETLKDRLNLKPSSTQQNVPRVNFICCLHPHLRGNSTAAGALLVGWCRTNPQVKHWALQKKGSN